MTVTNCYYYLIEITFRIFSLCLQDMDAIRMLKLTPTTLVIYLTLLESHYSSFNPYHNNIHAADVAQSVNVLLRRPALRVTTSSVFSI